METAVQHPIDWRSRSLGSLSALVVSFPSVQGCVPSVSVFLLCSQELQEAKPRVPVLPTERRSIPAVGLLPARPGPFPGAASPPLAPPPSPQALPNGLPWEELGSCPAFRPPLPDLAAPLPGGPEALLSEVSSVSSSVLSSDLSRLSLSP